LLENILGPLSGFWFQSRKEEIKENDGEGEFKYNIFDILQ
jgi:hypothetical protein